MRSRRAALALVGTLSLCYAYFYQAGGWNQNSRFDLTRAVVERGSTRIDAYHWNTGDKARVGGHFYSDKAPGQAFVAVPVVAAAELVAGLETRRGVGFASWLATVLTSGLPVAVGALALLHAALLLGASRGAALFCALAFGLGTPLWAYATLFMGHALAAACLAIAFWSLVAIQRGWASLTPLAAVHGLACGWAVVTEYTAAPVAALFGIAAAVLLVGRSGGWRAAARPLAALFGVSLACAALLGAYQASAFGSVWETPLRHLYLFPHVRDQPFTAPRVAALYEILLGAHRGLLPLAPLLVLAPVGVAVAARRPDRRMAVLGAAAVVVYYVVLNASFATPMAGWSYGPRYLGAALPFAALPLAFVWDAAPRRWQRAALVAALLWGAFLALVAVATTAQPPEVFRSPVTELLLPAFADGDLALNHQSFDDASADPHALRGGGRERAAWNLGLLVGLSGGWSLVPLALVGMASFPVARRWLRGAA